MRQHKHVPEVPVRTREESQVSCHNSRKTRRFCTQREMRLFSAEAFLEKSHIPTLALKWSLTPMKQLKKFPDIHVPMREDHRGSSHNSRRAPFFPPHLKMRAHFPASSGNESQRSCRTSRGGGLNLKLERNSRDGATIQKDTDVPIHSR